MEIEKLFYRRFRCTLPPLIAPAPAGRVASVDALRGLTILLMIFVNDLGRAAPSWMHHIQPPNADGMTLADVVFPAFLFIVGVSIPLAFERAESAGVPDLGSTRPHPDSHCGAAVHGRDRLNNERGQRRRPASCGACWRLHRDHPGVVRRASRARPRAERADRPQGASASSGSLLLLALFRASRHPPNSRFLGRVEGWVWMRTGWWGILGLDRLGLPDRRHSHAAPGPSSRMADGCAGDLDALHLAMQQRRPVFTRLDDKPWLGPVDAAVKVLAVGSRASTSYVSLGDATGSLGRDHDGRLPAGKRSSGATAMSRRIAIGFAGRRRSPSAFCWPGSSPTPSRGSTRIAATPTWCFWSAALTCLTWMSSIDSSTWRGIRGWSILVRPAGANPLVAYFLHPITVLAVGLAGLGGTLLGYTNRPTRWLWSPVAGDGVFRLHDDRPAWKGRT